MDHHAHGFVYHSQILIFKHHIDRQILRNKSLRHVGRLKSHLTRLEGFDQMRHFGHHLLAQRHTALFDHVFQVVTRKLGQ